MIILIMYSNNQQQLMMYSFNFRLKIMVIHVESPGNLKNLKNILLALVKFHPMNFYETDSLTWLGWVYATKKDTLCGCKFNIMLWINAFVKYTRSYHCFKKLSQICFLISVTSKTAFNRKSSIYIIPNGLKSITTTRTE